MDQVVPAAAYWYEIRVGWPFLALGGEYAATEPKDIEVVAQSAGVLPFTRNTAFTGPWAGYYQLIAMPLIPQRVHFAARVALYGLVAFGLVTLIRGIRRWRRRKPGLCKKCGYDLRGSAERCPECGAAIG